MDSKEFLTLFEKRFNQRRARWRLIPMQGIRAALPNGRICCPITFCDPQRPRQTSAYGLVRKRLGLDHTSYLNILHAADIGFHSSERLTRAGRVIRRRLRQITGV